MTKLDVLSNSFMIGRMPLFANESASLAADSPDSSLVHVIGQDVDRGARGKEPRFRFLSA